MSSRRNVFLLVLLLVAIGAAGLVAVTRLRRPPSAGSDKHVLVYDVPGDIEESAPNVSPYSLSALRPDRPSLREITDAVRRAGEDEHIRALSLHVGGAEWGWAKVAEMREALSEFQTRGKPVYVSFSGGSDQAYLLVSGADRIAMPQTALLGLDGLTASAMFLKGTYDKVGIRPNFAHVGSFKSAVEQYTRTDLSPDGRRALEELLDDEFALLVDSLASARGVPRDSMIRLIDRGPFPAGSALAAGLIDTLLDEAELDSLACARAGTRVTPITMTRYLEQLPELDTGGPAIALVTASGTIVPGRDRDGMWDGRQMGSESLVRALQQARLDKSVKAVVLRVDSPGGSGQASDDIWQEIRRLRKTKPLVVSMSNLAASGGYYIACGSDGIVAQPGTITGSIGVFGGKLNILGLYQKLGLNIETVSRGKHAEMMSPFKDFSPEELESFQFQMDDFYRVFLDRVSSGRGMTAPEVDSIAQGRVWSGAAARRLGLVDTLGGLQTAISLARDRAGIPEEEEVRVRPYPDRHRAHFQRFITSFLDDDEETEVSLLARLPSPVVAWLHAASFPAGTALALMPYSIVIR